MNLRELAHALVAMKEGGDEVDFPPFCYLAGPMTSVYVRSEIDLLQLCKLASHIECVMREQGFIVINPYGSCLDTSNFEKPKELFLEQDLYIIGICDLIILLPGWRASQGVREYELPLAEELGLGIYEWMGDGELKVIQEPDDVQSE